MKRGAWLTTITESHGGRQLRLFSVADVKAAYRLRVPELTRQEVWSTLRHYHSTGRFFMLSGACARGGMGDWVVVGRLQTRRGASLPARPRPDRHPSPPRGSPAEPHAVDPFAVEYYRVLSSGIPRELFNAAMYTPGKTSKDLVKRAHAATKRAASKARRQ